jgi:predicted kinase
MKPIFAVMIGISGSGKSHYATGLKTSLTVENKLPTELVETDAIRQELFGNAADQSQGSRVFATARARVSSCLGQDKNCIIDATSPTRRDRKDWIILGKTKGAEVRAYFVNTPVSVAKTRNLKRARAVPEWVIDKQAAKLTPPAPDEGFDKIVVI